MELGISLIDKAAKACGSDSKLAKKIGVHRVAIAEMRSGKRKLSPETAAQLADIAGEDVNEAIHDAMIERSKGTRLEGVMRAILGKGTAAGVGAVLLSSYSGSSIAGTVQAITIDNIYTVFNTLYIVLSNWCSGKNQKPAF